MKANRIWCLRTLAAVAVAGIAHAASAQPFTEHTPTKKDPLRFTAFAVQMQSGMSGELEISLERWSTDDERKALIALADTAKEGESGQAKLLKALQHIKPRCGFIRTANSIGWDLMYAYESKLPDGSRQIVIATDKHVGFLQAASDGRSMDYPFTLVEMRFPAGTNKGEGKLLVQSSISTKNGRLELELYGQEPTRLTTITEQKDKKKKTS